MIRLRIHVFYTAGEFPTLPKVLDIIKDDDEDFPEINETSLWRLLKKWDLDIGNLTRSQYSWKAAG